MSPILEPRITTARAAAGDGGSLAVDVLAGLTRSPKELPPKHLYDERGSQLFDEICTVAEYYPTRTERAILRESAQQIIARTGATEIIELGSGTAAKTRVLLDAMRDAGQLHSYVPFDIDDSVIRVSVAAIQAEYPEIESVHGVVGDFERNLNLIPAPTLGTPRIVAFLGGTLGNFVNPARERLLSAIASLLRPGDHALLGADLVKNPVTIEAAYNDSRGITAEFNLNVLRVINRELGADFEVEKFEHVAFYDREHEWIEMRLRATEAMNVYIRALDLRVSFAQGEEIRTEISAKFSRERLVADLHASGLMLTELYTDVAQLYGLALAAPPA